MGGGSGGASQSLGSSVSEALESYLGRLPPQFNMVEIESRVEERTPYVTVALQVRRALTLCIGRKTCC